MSNYPTRMLQMLKSLKANMCIFIRKNKLIFSFFIISIVVISSYFLTMDWPELFKGAELWFNFLFQLSVGYMINFMFYVTQVYVPNNRKEAVARKNVSVRLEQIVRYMRDNISSLSKIYLENHKSDAYTEEEFFNVLCKLRFSDYVKVLDAARTTRENLVYFTVREWIRECIYKTEDEVDKLYRYYSFYISEELMRILEKILHSNYHSFMRTLLVAPNDVDFSQCTNFLFEYYMLICELENVNKKDYLIDVK